MFSCGHFTANCREQALGVIFQNIAVYYPIDDAIDVVAEPVEEADLPSSPPETILEKPSQENPDRVIFQQPHRSQFITNDPRYPLWMD
jgi:hypothetical protein